MIDPSSFRGRRLCVVGNLNRDLRTAPITPGEHLLRDGETSTRFVQETAGGGGTNSALFAARLGANVRRVARGGDDGGGRALGRKIRRAGVRLFLALARTHPPGTSITLVYDPGHRHFVSSLESCAIRFDE